MVILYNRLSITPASDIKKSYKVEHKKFKLSSKVNAKQLTSTNKKFLQSLGLKITK